MSNHSFLIPLVLDKHLMVTIERCKNNNLNKFNCTFVYQKGGSQRIYIYIYSTSKGGNYVNVLMCTILFTVYCLLTIGALWLMGTQNITYKIQVNGEGFAYYTEHIV